ncbi:hypothetical protein MJ1_0206 [Nanobdella aerobiophila]|uniref:Uncharacterized protein n=1 Tax=Nanobdella aerobiophila TaxID=2586965 RepID=A0A915SI32_9ARCH|nr:hypothetical protein [Nanobdella aerobiophila]BBL45377.1 hypothetical protein MJ1_0206 [Nanobdella aerobiophila]
MSREIYASKYDLILNVIVTLIVIIILSSSVIMNPQKSIIFISTLIALLLIIIDIFVYLSYKGKIYLYRTKDK